MLETEEVDDDYFTPVTSTSLANIFGNTVPQQETDSSLKYKPPKPQKGVPKSEEEPKGSQCLFACALIGYEWYNNTYTARGKLGFAIMKIIKTGKTNMVLYDANKVTLSCTIVTPKLDITVNENTFISYYDNAQKYWSIYGTEEEIKKIEELLKSLNVPVKYSSGSDKPLPETMKQEDNIVSTIDQDDKEDIKESDTDTSAKKKTRISILNRMASMGHSVLPPHASLTERTSDSSDTNDSSSHPKVIRHKPTKNLVRRSIPEKHVSEQHIVANPQTEQQNPDVPLFTYVNSQLMPVTHTNIISNATASNSDMNMYISEQRICNSELRINMNRMTDRLDQIANKVDELQHKNKDQVTNFQMDILQKLLSEYESKIKFYEELIKSKNSTDTKSESTSTVDKGTNEIGVLQMKVTTLEQMNKDKSIEIRKLHEQINHLKHNIDNEKETNEDESNHFTEKISRLENQLLLKSNEAMTVTQDSKRSQSDFESKLKIIMNDTFHVISNNFVNDENYTGETIKKVIASVIKKVTVNCLSEL